MPIIVLPVITLLAAIVNGAVGYGFSSITVPLALLFLTSRVLNPTLVLLEVVLNAYVLFVNRAGAPAVWRRVLPIIFGLAPGIVVGTLIVSRVDPDWLKLGTFAVLLPLILLQAAGLRRPIRAERTAGSFIGAGVGVLYAVTTISGPPLAVLLNNQGLVKLEFRAAMALIRLTVSTLTTVAYSFAGLVTAESVALLPVIVPSVVIGVPVGAWIIRHVQPETFRRVCMSVDAWVVGFGLSTLLRVLRLADAGTAYSLLLAVIAIDVWLLHRFFTTRHSVPS